MSYAFNGTNQYISGNAPVTALPMTFACWANSNAGTSAQTMINISRDPDGSTHRLNLNLQGTVAGTPIRGVQIGTEGTFNANAGAFGANVWQHSCCVFASSNSRTAYRNGVPGTTNTSTVNTSLLSLLYVGAVRLAASPGNYMSGNLMEVGIWNAALTTAEVLSLARGISCHFIRPQSLVFYAPLIRELQDLRNNLTLTNNNTATVVPHQRIYC
jgi:hypothetical protein